MKKITSFLSKPKRVALELGTSWVKIAQAQLLDQQYKIVGLSVKRMLDIKTTLAPAMKQWFREMDITGNEVTLIIPRHFVTIKNLELPSTDTREIKEIIDLQISKQTPYSRDEIVFGFKVLQGNTEGYSNVLLAIVKKNIIEERLKLLRELQLEAGCIRISSEMAYQYFLLFSRAKHLKESTALIIDIDEESSEVFVLSAGEPVFSRNIFIGREFILKNPDDWERKFSEEIKRLFELYHHEGHRAAVERVLITGATDGLADVLTFVRLSLNLPVEKIDILDIPICMPEEASSIKVMSRSVSLSSVIGALCSQEKAHINLLPREIEIERQVKYKAKYLTITGIFSVAVLILLSALLLEKFYTKKHYYELLHAKFIKSETEAGDIESIKVKANTIRKYLDKKNSVVNILQELFKITPDQIYFRDIHYVKNKEVILTGSSEAMSDVFKFVTILEALECFENIKTNYATKKQKNGKDVVDFELICPLKE
ncbi:MAG: pilus assembly protein PilM [Candidatus Omnitrophota bacterium]